MKVNDIYKTESSLFPAKQNDIARICIIREVTGNEVIFSVAEDRQPDLKKGIMRFYTSTFKLSRAAFEEHFTYVDSGIDMHLN